MGTIVKRLEKDGTPSFTAQIRKKRKGKVVLDLTETFGTRRAAETWVRRQEGGLKGPGALKRAAAAEMLLLARHEGREALPFRVVAEDHFGMTPEALEKKIRKGDIAFPFATQGKRSLRSQEIPLLTLARYIEDRRAKATITMTEYINEKAAA